MSARKGKLADAIVAYLTENGPQSRAVIEFMLELNERHVTRTLKAMVEAQPKRIYRCRWEHLMTNKFVYLAPIYAVGDEPCVPMPVDDRVKKTKAKKAVKDKVVWVRDTSADALTEATAGWQHNVSAKPWNTHATQISYNPRAQGESYAPDLHQNLG